VVICLSNRYRITAHINHQMKIRLLTPVLIAFILALSWLASSSVNTATGQTSGSPIYHDMVLDETRQRIYATDRWGNALHVIDMSTLAVIKQVPIGNEPRGVDLSPDSSQLAVAVRGNNAIAFINTDTFEIANRSATQPADVTYGRAGRLYSTPTFGNILAWDTVSLTVVAQGPSYYRGEPFAAITSDTQSLFVADGAYSPESILRFDVSTDVISITASTAITISAPIFVDRIAVSPDGDRVFTSSGFVFTGMLGEPTHVIKTSDPVSLPDRYWSEVEFIPATNRLTLLSDKDATLSLYEANGYSRIFRFVLVSNVNTNQSNRPVNVGVARATKDGTRIYVTTSEGVKALNVAFDPIKSYLPAVAKPIPGISGFITAAGAPMQTMVELRVFDGQTWSTWSIAYSDNKGQYVFNPDVIPAALQPGQRMYVRFSNPYTPYYVAVWGAPLITRYTRGDAVQLDPFDIADVALVAPSAGVTVPLPSAFSWRRRVATLSDSYAVEVFDGEDGDPYFSSAPLGYVGNMTISGLPIGFQAGMPYYWGVIVYDGKGGLGLSFFSRLVTFGTSGANVAFAPQLTLTPKSIHLHVVHGDDGQ